MKTQYPLKIRSEHNLSQNDLGLSQSQIQNGFDRQNSKKQVQILREQLKYIEELVQLLKNGEDMQAIKEEISIYHQHFSAYLHQPTQSQHIINQNGQHHHQNLVNSINKLLSRITEAYNHYINNNQDYNAYRDIVFKSYNQEATTLQDSKSLLDPQSIPQQHEAIVDQFRTAKLLNLQNYPHIELFESTTYPWEAFARLPSYLEKLISQVPLLQRNKGTIIGSVFIADDVLIGSGTIVEHGAVIRGPAIIGKDCQLRKGAYVRGNVIVGDNSVIGNSCELKNSIIFEKCQIPHFNYVGDSILAKRVHLAAGVITSNLKLDSTEVRIKIGSKTVNTNLRKLGAIIGESVQIGCNAVLNPGSIIGSQSMLYAGVNFRGYLPSGRILKLSQEQLIVQLRK